LGWLGRLRNVLESIRVGKGRMRLKLWPVQGLKNFNGRQLAGLGTLDQKRRIRVSGAFTI